MPIKKTRHMEQWEVDDRYLCSFWFRPAAAGDWHWNVIDLNTGHSRGGSASTEGEARDEITQHLETFNDQQSS